MDPNISYFDRLGILPSPRVKTVEDYLRESDAKCVTMDKVHKDPEQYFGSGASLYTPTGVLRDIFVDRFETEPFTTIVTDDVIRMKYKQNIAQGLMAQIIPGGIGGSAFEIEGMQFPYLKRSSSIDKTVAGLHESVHACRSQWELKGNSSNKLDSFEETIAYFSEYPGDIVSENMVPVGITVSLLVPLLSKSPVILVGGIVEGLLFYNMLNSSVAGIAGGLGIMAVLCGAAISQSTLNTIPRVRHYKKLLDQGEQEGVNMHYMILRANPDDFRPNHGLEEQIASKEGVKWDIIRNKYNIAKFRAEN